MIAILEPATGDAPFRIHHYPVNLIDRVTLRNGAKVTVRPVLPQDAALEQRFVKGLLPSTRYRRFHVGTSELSDSLLRYFTQIDYSGHLALIGETFDDGGNEIQVADARYIRRAGTKVADFAVVVDDSWQGQGLGGYLLKALGRAAHAEGIEMLEGDVLAGNEPMLNLARRLGAAVGRHPDEGRLLKVAMTMRDLQHAGDASLAPGGH
jgi:acetyltransferase